MKAQHIATDIFITDLRLSPAEQMQSIDDLLDEEERMSVNYEIAVILVLGVVATVIIERLASRHWFWQHPKDPE